jgi:hypothetical protein
LVCGIGWAASGGFTTAAEIERLRRGRLLKAREGGRASFTPRELAEIRLMVKLRALGLPLPESRKVAEEAAPGVIFAALANHQEKALAVEGPADVAAAYIKSLEGKADEEYLLALSDLPATKHVYRHAIIENGTCTLLKALAEDVMDEGVEVAGLINLWAVARAIVDAVPRPLFTLVVPRNFRAG